MRADELKIEKLELEVAKATQRLKEARTIKQYEHRIKMLNLKLERYYNVVGHPYYHVID